MTWKGWYGVALAALAVALAAGAGCESQVQLAERPTFESQQPVLARGTLVEQFAKAAV